MLAEDLCAGLKHRELHHSSYWFARNSDEDEVPEPAGTGSTWAKRKRRAERLCTRTDDDEIVAHLALLKAAGDRLIDLLAELEAVSLEEAGARSAKVKVLVQYLRTK